MTESPAGTSFLNPEEKSSLSFKASFYRWRYCILPVLIFLQLGKRSTLDKFLNDFFTFRFRAITDVHSTGITYFNLENNYWSDGICIQTKILSYNSGFCDVEVICNKIFCSQALLARCWQIWVFSIPAVFTDKYRIISANIGQSNWPP